MAQYHRPLALLLGLFVLLAVLYSVVIPPFETPDEIWHFAFVQHVASGQGLPVSEPGTQALWRQQGVQPPAYYLAAAALTAWIDQSDFPAIYSRVNPHAAIGQPASPINRNYLIHHRDEGWPWRGSILALHLSRFLSILLGALTVWAVYRIVTLLLGERAGLLGAALIAFIPQFIFISAAASNDNAINATAALAIWLLVGLVVTAPAAGQAGRGWPAGGELGKLLALGVLLGLAALSKLSGLALAGLAGLALPLAAWRRRSWRWLLGSGLAVGAPALMVAGWWYFRNWRLYSDPLAWNLWQANILLRLEPAGWQTIAAELQSLERSFWGLFGWMNVGYPDWVYTALRGLTLAVAAGWIVAAVRWLARSRRIDWRWAGGALLLAWLALLAISWLRFMRIAPAAQGRYFFPAAAALALLLVVGLQSLRLPRWPRDPAAWQPLSWAAVAGLLVLSVATPFWLIGPAYRPPAPAPAALTKLRAEAGGQAAIVGVAAQPAQFNPGETALVTVAWQALAPMPADYSVFVHLVSQDGIPLAQLDTMPGGGLRPTSQWAVGETVTDVYPVVIPATAFAPDRGQWAVGLYDQRSGQRLPLQEVAGPGSAVDDSLRFGAVEIVPRPGSVPNPLNVEFLDNISLVGYSLSSRTVQPGQPLAVTLYWQARGPVSRDYTTFVHLLDAAEQTWGGHDAAPQPPTSAWQPGQVVADIHPLVVSPDAPPGLYTLEIGLYSGPDLKRLSLVQSTGAEGADRLLLNQVRVLIP
ncbi:MAG TPA: glycosyltransferase family 39 protein [Anaerolineae bacterium]|nr:glycosyltransferase family 39 protein [Anaerolineae bacterium]